MKQCGGCGHVKPLTEFHKNPASSDGHSSRCSSCKRRDDKARTDALKLQPGWVETKRARERARPQRTYQEKGKNLRTQAITRRKWQIENPHKAQAHAAVKAAVASGVLRRPLKCEDCLSDNRGRPMEAHHADYEKPLRVDWLCRACHRKRHRKG